MKIAIKRERKNIFSTGEILGDRIFTKAFMSAKKKEAQSIKKIPAERLFDKITTLFFNMIILQILKVGALLASFTSRRKPYTHTRIFKNNFRS